MEKRVCDIVKDLMPSYAEGICSAATKEYVEEHIRTCEECRRVLEAYRDNVLTDEKLEQKGVDGLKKIRKKMKLQTIVCYLVLVFLVYCGIQVFLANHTNYIIFSRPALLLAICILANLLASMGYKGRNAPGRLQYLLGGISFVLDLYLVGLFFYIAFHLKPEVQTIFGMELMKVGPFLERQLIAIFIAQLAFFACNLWCIIKQDKNCGWLLNLNMTGIFLMINYDIWMKSMDGYETLVRAITRDTLGIAVIGVLGIAASLILTKAFQKKEA